MEELNILIISCVGGGGLLKADRRCGECFPVAYLVKDKRSRQQVKRWRHMYHPAEPRDPVGKTAEVPEPVQGDARTISRVMLAPCQK